MSSKEGGNEPAAGKSQSPSKEKDDDVRSSSSSGDSAGAGSTNDVVLSLRDPAYLDVLHRYFRKLGSRSNPNPGFTEADAAKEMFDMFNKKGGKFLKLKNSRSIDKGYIEVDDEEALDSEYII